ncbi:MAG: UDP-3-O-(3-hydroxymyristoyl)glucosamine N-acyltransferase [Chlamydiae bacterium CG10_big_fil_rev_8_21_14_0_10_42_34]|nr:MAG: UDP-3-O-(3-hydroxymyristoyl)glucosamine N-acyltransferase [Chlamydiae bacterium CG10_big_fil_rev_8_21_14_0_10_42_34]
MSYTLQELSVICDAQLVGNSNLRISGVNTLDEAGPEDVSFLANPRYNEAMKSSNAGVICVNPNTPLPDGKNFLLSEDPSKTFQQIVELLLPPKKTGFEGIHPTAVIHPTAEIGENVTIGPLVVIDRNVKIGPNTVIDPHVSVGFEVTIGSDCHIHANCTIREKCILGNRVILQPGVVVGSCGFGYITDKLGNHIKLEQVGIVILEDDVEIGANTTIDRSRFKATIVRKGSKIDNLVQIAHNVEIGENNIIAAQTGIAGSAKTGKYVMLGGQVGIVGHVELDDQVMVATRGGVSKSLKAGKYRGSPAIAINEFHRQEVHVRKLEEYVQRLKKIEKKLQ